MEEKTKSFFSDQAEENGFKTAGQKAYDIISQKILNGEFEPGLKLSRRKMADVTGVSVIPVIEALNRLEEDGLVESKPQWGSFVTVPTRRKIEEMYMLREAIECQVARILSQTMTQEQEQALRLIAKQLDNVKFAKETHVDISKLHYQFHYRMTEFTGYTSLQNALRRTNLFYLLYKAVAHTRVNAMIGPRYWHELLIDEIKVGDQSHAEIAMRKHVDESLQAILRDI
ncbi:GntR family transcriptional regulator [Pelobacter seleniigenes]|uniref:GntR family transcriptional regulator n=1 Tax=Pelobacter seleniigenes TaxID=407188 RepID=UPI0006914B8C|nr:GntR family transcriptional regulator [Pelobacter seleniigenes]